MHNFHYKFRISYILRYNLTYSHSYMLSFVITYKYLVYVEFVVIYSVIYVLTKQIFIPPWPLSHSYSHQIKLHINFSVIAMLLF
jgi:hypothetical protein